MTGVTFCLYFALFILLLMLVASIADYWKRRNAVGGGKLPLSAPDSEVQYPTVIKCSVLKTGGSQVKCCVDVYSEYLVLSLGASVKVFGKVKLSDITGFHFQGKPPAAPYGNNAAAVPRIAGIGIIYKYAGRVEQYILVFASESRARKALNVLQQARQKATGQAMMAKDTTVRDSFVHQVV